MWMLRGLNSNPQACGASTSPTEPCPQAPMPHLFHISQSPSVPNPLPPNCTPPLSALRELQSMKSTAPQTERQTDTLPKAWSYNVTRYTATTEPSNRSAQDDRKMTPQSRLQIVFFPPCRGNCAFKNQPFSAQQHTVSRQARP